MSDKKGLINTDGIHSLMTLSQIPKFEILNPDFSLTVIGYDMDGAKCHPKVKPKGNSRKPKTEKEEKEEATKEEVRLFNYAQSNMSVLYNSKQKKDIHVNFMSSWKVTIITLF